MVRPSIKEASKEETLTAFSRYITKYGLAGSSLEKVAEESGLKRPLIRHYVGNREDLLSLLEEQVTDHSRQILDELLQNLSPERKSIDLVEIHLR